MSLDVLFRLSVAASISLIHTGCFGCQKQKEQVQGSIDVYFLPFGPVFLSFLSFLSLFRGFLDNSAQNGRIMSHVVHVELIHLSLKYLFFLSPDGAYI